MDDAPHLRPAPRSKLRKPSKSVCPGAPMIDPVCAHSCR